MSTTITTKVSCGDKIWTPFHKDPLTVGQIRVCLTNSKGINNGYVERVPIAFDNYKPQQDYFEEYMCEETGIGSGSIFRFGESAFLTQVEAQQEMARRKIS